MLQNVWDTVAPPTTPTDLQCCGFATVPAAGVKRQQWLRGGTGLEAVLPTTPTGGVLAVLRGRKGLTPQTTSNNEGRASLPAAKKTAQITATTFPRTIQAPPHLFGYVRLQCPRVCCRRCAAFRCSGRLSPQPRPPSSSYRPGWQLVLLACPAQGQRLSMALALAWRKPGGCSLRALRHEPGALRTRLTSTQQAQQADSRTQHSSASAQLG